jgi:FemAB-related protein (PEP-CTERM system-associated)
MLAVQQQISGTHECHEQDCPELRVHRSSLLCHLDWNAFLERYSNRYPIDAGAVPSFNLRWLGVLSRAFGHHPILIMSQRQGRIVGMLPLVEVQSILFGKFLVSLPYLNSAGVASVEPTAIEAMINEAVRIADEMDVRYLELRHHRDVQHPKLKQRMSSKVQMRLPLPSTAEELWNGFKSKHRSQIRKGQRQGFTVNWGSYELVDEFYQVFSRNMRDLGTPVYSKSFFQIILDELGSEAEICCIRDGDRPIAAALLTHYRSTTEVPSASSIREFNSSNANMLMYWCLLKRAIERSSNVFDFGRSTIDSNTFRFKKQWGAIPSDSVWQYYVRSGQIDAVRPENSKFSLAVRVWKRLPVPLTQLIGPPIVRGIP